MKNIVHTKSAGFTLVEMIIVIVLLGVLGVMGVDFISQAFKGFRDTDNRVEIYEEGKIALVRIELEIHNALPNAITLPSATELQVGMIDEVAMRNVFGTYSQVGLAQILDPTAGLPPRSDGNDPIISIYNLDWATDFNNGASAKLYRVTNPGNNPMNLHKNIITSSPQQRYYAVDKVVRYQLVGTTLNRAVATVGTAGVGAFGNNYPLARNVSGLTFSYAPAALTRNAVVSIAFTLTKGAEAINFHKEVHIRNVP